MIPGSLGYDDNSIRCYCGGGVYVKPGTIEHQMIMIRITLAFMTTTMLLVVMMIGGGGGGGDDGVHPNPLLSSLASINRVNIGEVVRNCNLALFINIFTIIIIVKAINHNRHTVNVCPSAEYCRPNMDGSATCVLKSMMLLI